MDKKVKIECYKKFPFISSIHLDLSSRFRRLFEIKKAFRR